MLAFDNTGAGDMDSDCVLSFLALNNTKGSWALAFIWVYPFFFFYKSVGRTTEHLDSWCQTQNTRDGQIQHCDFKKHQGAQSKVLMLLASFVDWSVPPSVRHVVLTILIFLIFRTFTENKYYLNCRKHCIHAAWVYKTVSPCSHQPSKTDIRHFTATTCDCGRTRSGGVVALLNWQCHYVVAFSQRCVFKKKKSSAL